MARAIIVPPVSLMLRAKQRMIPVTKPGPEQRQGDGPRRGEAAGPQGPAGGLVGLVDLLQDRRERPHHVRVGEDDVEQDDEEDEK